LEESKSIIREAEERARKEAESKAKTIVREAEERARKEAESKAKTIVREAEERARKEAESKAKTIVRERELKVNKEAEDKAKAITRNIEDKAKREAEQRAKQIVKEAEDKAKVEAVERATIIVDEMEQRSKREAEEGEKKEELLKKAVNLDKEEPFQIGVTLAKLLTLSWNSQQNPSKVHIFNRRIHHGEIGTLLGLSNLCTKYPIPAGILAGIGSGLVKDDHDDMKEWFTFKKKK
jgi:chemotaxis protein histidine kinase CheA